eukprot:superscaffoldBa00002022_g12906
MLRSQECEGGGGRNSMKEEREIRRSPHYVWSPSSSLEQSALVVPVGEEESVSFLPGLMLRVANCRNERNGMMESH